jgi:hypothetical protein
MEQTVQRNIAHRKIRTADAVEALRGAGDQFRRRAAAHSGGAMIRIAKHGGDLLAAAYCCGEH